MKRTKGPWRWLSKETLVADHGRRPVVLSANEDGQLVQRNEDGLLRPIDLAHPDIRALAGSARLIEALEAFLALRTSIFPSVRGPDECAALHELEAALQAAGGKVPYPTAADEAVEDWVKKGIELESQGFDPGIIGRHPKKK